MRDVLTKLDIHQHGGSDRVNFRSRNLINPIKDAIASQKPFLGICLGLQILF
jgi:imidazoleglycerol phosphate synthase glutamine amidotransferase subunit HisH